MEFTAWFSLAFICLMGAMTPGPSLIVILKNTVSGGRINGVAAGIAHGFGVIIYATLTIVGLAIMIKSTPWLFDLIKYSGVIFLVWLAIKALRSKGTFGKMIEPKSTITIRKSITEGLMISFLNPKLAIFFLALFSQFVDGNASLEQNVIMVSTAGGIDILWYCFVAIMLSQSAVLNKLRDNVHIIEKITGVALLAVAARIAL